MMVSQRSVDVVWGRSGSTIDSSLTGTPGIASDANPSVSAIAGLRSRGGSRRSAAPDHSQPPAGAASPGCPPDRHPTRRDNGREGPSPNTSALFGSATTTPADGVQDSGVQDKRGQDAGDRPGRPIPDPGPWPAAPPDGGPREARGCRPGPRRGLWAVFFCPAVMNDGRRRLNR